MLRLRRVLLYLVFGFLLAAALTELFVYAQNVTTRRRAEALLRAIRQLRPGESTFSSTQGIRTDFASERVILSPVSGSPAEREYKIFVSNSLYNFKYRFPGLWRFGLRPSGVEVDLIYRNDILSSATYMLVTPVMTSSGPVELDAGAVRAQSEATVANNREQQDLHVVYRIRPSSIVANGTQVHLGARVTERATREERDAAFDFDLSCLSSLRGCEAFCLVMPSLWREAARGSDYKDAPLVEELLENPNCSGRVAKSF